MALRVAYPRPYLKPEMHHHSIIFPLFSPSRLSSFFPSFSIIFSIIFHHFLHHFPSFHFFSRDSPHRLPPFPTNFDRRFISAANCTRYILHRALIKIEFWLLSAHSLRGRKSLHFNKGRGAPALAMLFSH